MEQLQTQERLIRKHLESGKSITPLEALNLFGCFRLGARIWDLRDKGLNIITERFKTPSGKTVAKYSLVK